MPGPTRQRPTSTGRRNAGVAVALSFVLVAMLGLSFAAVPLYRIFCQVTGLGGTTQVATAVPEATGAAAQRTIKVRFNADISPDLPWSFRPAQREIEVPLGARKLAHYVAESRAGMPTTGTATFNVTPLKAGAYFAKIDCFCFTEQRLTPGQRADMPVSFFVDPALLDDPDMAEVKTITLSYTFFPKPDAAPATGDQSAAVPGSPAAAESLN